MSISFSLNQAALLADVQAFVVSDGRFARADYLIGREGSAYDVYRSFLDLQDAMQSYLKSKESSYEERHRLFTIVRKHDEDLHELLNILRSLIG